jgi:hypothetical protein
MLALSSRLITLIFDSLLASDVDGAMSDNISLNVICKSLCKATDVSGTASEDD